MKDSEAAAAALLLLSAFAGGGKKRDPVVGPGDLFLQTTTQWPMPTMVVKQGDLTDDNAKTLDTFAPVISDGFRKSRADHNGVDMMYKRRMSFTDATQAGWRDYLLKGLLTKVRKTWDAKRYPPPEGSEWFFCPKTTPIRPFAAGRLWHASASPRGLQVLVDHGEFVTYYQHLSQLNVPLAQNGKLTADVPGGAFKKGDVFPVGLSTILGRAGADPLGGKLSPVHLHFECWRYVRGAGEGNQVRAYLDPEVALQTAAQWAIDVAEV